MKEWGTIYCTLFVFVDREWLIVARRKKSPETIVYIVLCQMVVVQYNMIQYNPIQYITVPTAKYTNVKPRCIEVAILPGNRSVLHRFCRACVLPFLLREHRWGSLVGDTEAVWYARIRHARVLSSGTSPV